MVRILLNDFEEMCGDNLSVTEPFIPWLSEPACDLLNKYKVRKGNKTEWGTLKGRPYSGEVCPFGSPVMFRISGPVQGGVMRERWFDGRWFGVQFISGEHLVATSDGQVVRARAVHPRPDTVRVTKESLVNVKVGPWSPSEVITQGTVGTPNPTPGGVPTLTGGGASPSKSADHGTALWALLVHK